MARIRYLKPDFFKDEDLAVFPYETRLFFAGLWNFADKAGRLEDRPKRLKVEIFPYDDVNIDKSLKLLSQTKNGSNKPFIQRYKVEGEHYIQIVSWNKHQKPHHTEAESKIPPAPPLTIKGTIKGMESVEQATTKLDNVPISVKEPLKDITISIINDLNEVLGTHYKTNTKNIKDLIQTRLNDKFTIEDFKTVHRKMLKAWGNDSKMVDFLRPITLYGTKFESYLNMKETITGKPNKRQPDYKAPDPKKKYAYTPPPGEAGKIVKDLADKKGT